MVPKKKPAADEIKSLVEAAVKAALEEQKAVEKTQLPPPPRLPPPPPTPTKTRKKRVREWEDEDTSSSDDDTSSASSRGKKRKRQDLSAFYVPEIDPWIPSNWVSKEQQLARHAAACAIVDRGAPYLRPEFLGWRDTLAACFPRDGRPPDQMLVLAVSKRIITILGKALAHQGQQLAVERELTTKLLPSEPEAWQKVFQKIVNKHEKKGKGDSKPKNFRRNFFRRKKK